MHKSFYQHVGKMIAVSLFHGGRAPSCLASSVVHYITGSIDRVKPRVEDIRVQVMLKKVIKQPGNPH